MKKNSNGDGSFSKRKNRIWRVQIMDGYQDNGTRKIVSFYAPTKGEASLKLQAYREIKGAGDNNPDKANNSRMRWTSIDDLKSAHPRPCWPVLSRSTPVSCPRETRLQRHIIRTVH